MSDPQTNLPDNESQDGELERRTGGFSGQAGYQSEFAEGGYRDAETAESGHHEDRAGSREDGYAPGKPGDALNAQPPRDDVGSDAASNNYNEGRETDEAGNTVVED
ncbi:MAG TPA: hypothetical protein VGE07_26910 [Herpetosiphonaceae bacterium]